MTDTSIVSAMPCFHGSVMAARSSPPLALPLANVTVGGTAAAGCTPQSQLAAGKDATFEFCCLQDSHGAKLTVWARQYMPRVLRLGTSANIVVELESRSIPGFPASRWRFDGWVLEAETADVSQTNISFLAHPSAYRTPSGRIFLISTANTHAGPGWTQGYWQEPGATRAIACKGSPARLIHSPKLTTT